MPATGTPEQNSVVQLFMCTDVVMGPPDDIVIEDHDLPDVAPEDVLELDEHLAGGWKCSGPSYATLRLATLNLRQAEALGLPAEDVRKCATTLLVLAQDDDFLLSATLYDAANALRHFHVGELGLLGYHTCQSLGRALLYKDQGSETPRAAYPYAIRYYELAAEWLQHCKDLDEADRTVLQAHALSELGYALSFGGDHASAENRLNDALTLLPASDAADSSDQSQARANILSNLSRVREERNDIQRATELQAQVVSIEEKLAVTRKSELGVFYALQRLADLQQKARLYGDARGALERSLGMLKDDSDPLLGHSRLLMRAQLVEVLKAGGWRREAKELLTKTLAEEGVEAAGISGHDDARKVLDLGWAWHEDYSESPPISAQEQRLLGLLNADPELVEQMRAEAEAKVGLSEVPIVLGCSTPAHWIVRDHEEERVRFYGCVLTLQRVADAICPGGEASTQDATGAIRFRDFALGEVEQLRQVASRGERLARFWIMAGGLGETEGYFNYNNPDGDCYCPQPCDERVDLLIDTREVAEWEASTYDVRIAGTLRLLLQIAKTGNPCLRKCRVPSGIAAHWDYLLEEREADAPECGTFYLAERGGSTCGRAVCKQNYTLLQNEKRALWQRAEELAEADFKAAGSPGAFVAVWEKARQAAGDDPKQALLHLRELLRSSPHKERGKM